MVTMEQRQAWRAELLRVEGGDLDIRDWNETDGGSRVATLLDTIDDMEREHAATLAALRLELAAAQEEGREVRAELHRTVDKLTAAGLQLAMTQRRLDAARGPLVPPIGFNIEETLALRERARAAGGRLVLIIDGEQVGELVINEAHK